MKQENEPKSKELGPNDLMKVLHILLLANKGIIVPEEVLENYPKDQKIVARYDEENKRYFIFAPVKRKRGIVKPEGRLILPG